MTSVEILLTPPRSVWTLSLYTKQLAPVELYTWLMSNFPIHDECLLYMSVEREQYGRSRRQLARSASLSDDLDKIVGENPTWHIVRLNYIYDPNTVLAIDNIRLKLTPLGRFETLTEQVDRATLIGAVPNRRKINDSTTVLNRSEILQLVGIQKKSMKNMEKINKCFDEFSFFLKNKGLPNLTVDLLRQLATKNNLVSGHWAIYGESIPMQRNSGNSFPETTLMTMLLIEKSWKQLLTGILWGPLESSRATGISFKRTPDGRSMTISNPRCLAIQKRLTSEDPFDDEVLSVDKAIRDCGYKGDLKYKPDVFSACRITHSNQSIIRPTIYRSIVDSRTDDRIVDTLYTRSYSPEVVMGDHHTYRVVNREAALFFGRGANWAPSPLDVKWKTAVYSHFFLTDRSEPQSCGSTCIRQGVRIAIPLSMTFDTHEESRSYVDKVGVHSTHGTKLTLDVDSDLGNRLVDTFVLSDNAKQFAIHRELRLREGLNAFLMPVFNWLGCTAVSSLVVVGLNVNFGMALSLAISTLLLVGLCHHLNRELSISVQFDADSKTVSYSDNHRKGALEYLQKCLQRNVLIRHLLGSEGRKLYSKEGDCLLCNSVPITERFDRIRRLNREKMSTDSDRTSSIL